MQMTLVGQWLKTFASKNVTTEHLMEQRGSGILETVAYE